MDRDLSLRVWCRQGSRLPLGAYRRIVDLCRDGILVISRKGVVYANPAMKELCGYDVEDFWKDPELVLRLMLPESRQQNNALWEYFRSHGRFPEETQEWVIQHRDGGVRWLETKLSNWSGRGGRARAGVMLVRNVTARKKAEADLRTREERFRALVEHAFDGISVVNAQGRVLYHSSAPTGAAGFADVEGTQAFERVHPDDVPEMQARFAEVLARPGVSVACSVRVRSDGGDWRLLECRARNLLEHPAVGGIVVNWRDITEQHRAEDERRSLAEQVLYAQKMESLGVMAGGVAHDFNNLLTTIMGFASLALREVPASAPAHSMLQEVLRAGQRAGELTRQMLAFSGRGPIMMQPVNLSVLVGDMVPFLQSVVTARVKLHCHLPAGLPRVQVDFTQCRQALLNLVTNAIEALGEQHGDISIQTGEVHLDRPELYTPFAPAGIKPGVFAYVEIKDSGPGMPPDMLQKIFDPFFTTKFPGRGLGLAVVLGFVRSHGGLIKVESAPGQGSRFRLLFPSVEPRPEPAPLDPRHVNGWRGQGTVLIADDEQSIRDLVQQVLERVGFQMLVAADGEQALALFQQHQHDIVLVLLDWTMPQRGGWETFQELRRRAPDVPVVLMSGFQGDAVLERCTDQTPDAFISKPFTPVDLLRVIRATLEKRSVAHGRG